MADIVNRLFMRLYLELEEIWREYGQLVDAAKEFHATELKLTLLENSPSDDHLVKSYPFVEEQAARGSIPPSEVLALSRRVPGRKDRDATATTAREGFAKSGSRIILGPRFTECEMDQNFRASASVVPR